MEIVAYFDLSLLNINNIVNYDHNVINPKFARRVLYKKNNNYFISYIYNNDFSEENILKNTIVVYDQTDSNLINYFNNNISDKEEAKKIKEFIVSNASYNMQRKDVLSKDEYFMALAVLTAARSKDPNTQVGACIVSDKGRILSIGYNGTPNGFPDSEFPWSREGNILTTKYAGVCHAELNAILNFDGDKKDLQNSTLYVDLFPCNKCSIAIIQSGIKKIVYLEDKYSDTDEIIISKHLLDKCGVNYEQMSFDKEEVVNKVLKLKR